MTLLSFVCWLHPAMPAQKKRPKKKIGQAPALSRPLWKEWVKFIASECGARIAVVLSFTGFFGLRCSEALCLKREDISVRGEIPKIIVSGETQGNKKSPGEVYIRKSHLTWLKSLMKNGFNVQRKRKHRHGSCDFEDTYEVPESGFIFTSRKGAKEEHLHYHAIYAHVKRQAPRFSGLFEKIWPEVGPWGGQTATTQWPGYIDHWAHGWRTEHSTVHEVCEPGLNFITLFIQKSYLRATLGKVPLMVWNHLLNLLDMNGMDLGFGLTL